MLTIIYACLGGAFHLPPSLPPSSHLPSHKHPPSLKPSSLPSSLKPSSLPQTSSLPQAIFPPPSLKPSSLPQTSSLPQAIFPPTNLLPQAIFPLLPSTISRVISSGGGSNSLECDMWRAGESAESNKCMSEMGFFLTHYDIMIGQNWILSHSL